ncbi:MAG: DNA polymerase-3 subunit alpha [Candidatus Promineifilaceae bacterium]|jgi:DNA polymerase-3 subunit alpha
MILFKGAGNYNIGSMSKDPFVHLHLHTNFSLLDGACKIPDVMDAVEKHGMPAVGLTDHGVMYGAIDFYKACQSRGINPIIGCEAYITTGSRFDRKIEGVQGQSQNHHLVLLAKNRKGYENLVRLTSAAHLEGFYYKPRIDHELMAEFSEGLICMSGCLSGEVYTALSEDDVDKATQIVGQHVDIFGKENYFLEAHNHGIPSQTNANRYLLELSKNSGQPIVAANDVHYMEKGHADAHDVLLCMQTGTVKSDPKRLRHTVQEFYFKSRDEMDDVFREFPGSVDRTMDIAGMCNLELELGKLHFPTYKVPKGMTQLQFLIDLSHEGIRQRYRVEDPRNPKGEREKEIMDRFEMELGIIERTGFINYFLVVWDFVKYALDKNIPVGPGRGSGGGSLLAYVLAITAIDPLHYNLIFERFLNPERVSPPDFDIDFCQARRGEVIEYVKDKYGRQNCAQIITFGSLGAKSVIRDVGRVLEIPYAECDRLSKMVPDDPKMTLKKALEQNPEFKQTYETDPNCKRILDYSFVLEGLYRQPGTHAAGVVIGEKPLHEIIPLARDKNKETITQYTMEPLGDIGLLKMDFLGLKTLTVIQEAIDLIKRFHDVRVDLDNLPYDDAPTYELLNKGDTVGVFQLESSGMRDLLRRNGIDCIEDVIALIALYRPGPMNMLDDYVQRKTGKMKVTYPHPLLEPVLKETYGVMIYQEQVQKAANVLAGYSLGEADILRRAMGKKKASVMDEQRSKFVDGCKTTNNIDVKLAGSIFDTIAQFAGYGFNKAHSAGYAIVCYQTAYLKANYPVEFMCALLSSEIGNFDKIPTFINEVVEMGLQILGPDVQHSGVRFLPENTNLRYGLAGAKGVGSGAAEEIVKARVAEGPFKSLVDMVCRVESQNVNRKVLESLARCGACDDLDEHRAKVFGGIDFAMARAQSTMSDRRTGQGSLFDLMTDAPAEELTTDLPEAPRWHESYLLSCEKELLGTYLSGHPLTQHARILNTYGLSTLRGVAELEDKATTRIGGIASTVTRRMTKGDPPRPMAIVLFEDLETNMELLVFPECYAEYGHLLEADTPLLICGDVNRRDEQPKIVAQEIYKLEDAPAAFTKRISLHIPAATLTNEKLDRIKRLLNTHAGDTPVRVVLTYPTGEKILIQVDPKMSVKPSQAFISALEKEVGEKGIFVAANPNPLRKPRQERGNGRFLRNPAAKAGA